MLHCRAEDCNATSGDRVARARIRLLLVEDQTLLREALARALDSEPDLEVVGQCDSVGCALDVIARTRVDVVLLDINLGDEQGTSFVSRASAAGFEGRILIVTAGVGEREAAWLVRSGCSGIFLKDEGSSALVARIRAVHAGTSKLDPTSLNAIVAQLAAPSEIQPRRPLTQRERQVLRCVCQGLTNKEIGVRLDMTENTVKSFLQQLFGKFGVRTRARLVAVAIERYWEEIEKE